MLQETESRGAREDATGADGKDIILKVPEGTVIKDAASGKVIADMSGENTRQVVLKGGRGGNGNQHYATATMQAPKYAQPGQAAQELEIQLELKVIADVGLLGFPNVVKIHPSFQGEQCSSPKSPIIISPPLIPIWEW